MSNTLLNHIYPFFLDNIKLGHAFYLYEVVSPKMTEDFTPLVSFKKIGERTRKNDPCYDNGFNDLDILTVLTKSKARKNASSYLNEDIINRDKEVRKKEIKLYDMGEKRFPAFELSNLTTKATIVGIRDNLRWQFYKFYPGKLIDILLTPTEFGVFEIKGEGKELWLEQKAVYSTNDPGMTNPLEFKIPSSITNQKFKGNSELNKAIRAREWKAFDAIQ